MSLQTTLPQCEIKALPGVETPYRRTVIVPRVHTFWHSPLHVNDWSLKGIGQVMHWCRFDTGSVAGSHVRPNLIVGSPTLRAAQYRAWHFNGPWRAWHALYSEAYGPLRFSIAHATGESGSPTDQFGDNGPMVHARFYPAELSYWHNGQPSRWTELVIDGMPGLLHDRGAFDDECGIIGYFAVGRHGLDEVFVDDHSVEEIVILTGHSDKLSARAFLVPRWNGRSFRLPNSDRS